MIKPDTTETNTNETEIPLLTTDLPLITKLFNSYIEKIIKATVICASSTVILVLIIAYILNHVTGLPHISMASYQMPQYFFYMIGITASSIGIFSLSVILGKTFFDVFKKKIWIFTFGFLGVSSIGLLIQGLIPLTGLPTTRSYHSSYLHSSWSSNIHEFSAAFFFLLSIIHCFLTIAIYCCEPQFASYEARWIRYSKFICLGIVFSPILLNIVIYSFTIGSYYSGLFQWIMCIGLFSFIYSYLLDVKHVKMFREKQEQKK